MKLRGKLAGRKRIREEEDVKLKGVSDDEEESRTGAIKKKARQDPFTPRPKKQPRSELSAGSTTPGPATKAEADQEIPQHKATSLRPQKNFPAIIAAPSVALLKKEREKSVATPPVNTSEEDRRLCTRHLGHTLT
jgi:hypothetical protein